MKKLIIFIVFAVLATASCSKPKTLSNSTNNQVNLSNSANVNSIPNTNNSNLTDTSRTKSAVNGEMLKQIESQQSETADPRKVVKESKVNSNQTPKKTAGSSERQTW